MTADTPKPTKLATGRAFEAGKSRPHENASLVIRNHPAPEATTLEVLDSSGAIITSAPLPAVKVDPPTNPVSRRVSFPDGTVFDTTDSHAISQLATHAGAVLQERMESWGPHLAVIVGAVLVSAWLLYRYGLDILVALAVWLTPAALVEEMDRGIVTSVDYVMAEPTELPRLEQEKVDRIFTTLVDALPEEDRAATGYSLEFRDMPAIGANAFALPGGTVIITDDFVRRFGQRDILAGVLAHEIGHVVEQHGLRSVYRSLGIFVLVAFLAGDTGPVIEDILLEGNLVLSLANSREAELAADRFGVNLAQDAGYDPAGLATFLDRLSVPGGAPPDWLSTHPNSAERVEAIERQIDDLR